MPLITTRRALRGPINDYLSFELTFPGRLEGLLEVKHDDRALRVAERWGYDEDDWFPAFEGPEEFANGTSLSASHFYGKIIRPVRRVTGEILRSDIGQGTDMNRLSSYFVHIWSHLYPS